MEKHPDNSIRPLPRLFRRLAAGIVAVVLMVAVAACSTTSALPDGEKLFIGLKPTQYTNYEKNDHFMRTKEEMDVVLATKPNGSLFGSSSIRSPLPIGLWIWNAFSRDSTGFSRWMVKAFGKQPVLMSKVNPQLHALVGENTLKKRGYFDGKVDFDIIDQKHPKKQKVAYSVDLGRLWTLDSISYHNFPASTDSLMEANMDETYLHRGDPFDVAALENERQRIAQLFRDNGYYFYEKNYSSFLADTLANRGKVRLQLHVANNLDKRALRQWKIGKVDISLRNRMGEQLDSVRHFRHYKNFSLYYNGKRTPIRMAAFLNGMKLRSGQLYNQSTVQESLKKLSATGLFTRTNFTFTPRDITDSCRTLDLKLDCTFDKPYDFYVEAYAKGKTSGKLGPEIIVGLTRRNAFRGGELLNVNVHGSYEWQTGHSAEGSKTKLNSYSYGAEVSLTFPRIFNPLRMSLRKRIARARKKGKTVSRRRVRYFDTPTTTIKASTNVVNRPEYFKRHAVTGELRYNWRTSEQSSFEFSPLTLTYEYNTSVTDKYIDLLIEHPYLATTMNNRFIPKMSFSYSYHSPANYRNPISWWTTVSESANLLSLGYMVAGKKWSEHGKEMFKNPYAQFLKIETNLTKIWSIGEKSTLAAHVGGGVIWSYGNSTFSPYSEQFYVGGANSIRAFNARAIGPGKYKSEKKTWSYVEQVGDVKFQANLEYRPHLVGSLYGALFLDVGNVWLLDNYMEQDDTSFKFGDMFKQMAVGTGIGLRYDVGFFILRLDWGIGLHVPYETGRSGFYNIRHFKDAQALHLAIGLPF